MDPVEVEEKLSFTWSEHQQLSVLKLAGEVDVYTTPTVRSTIIDWTQKVKDDENTHHIVIDLSAVTFLDQTGLGMLVGTHKRETAYGIKLSLIVTERNIQRLFDVTGLVAVFDIKSDIKQILETP